jgi:transcriptional regulator with XRE-family HTH domain
MDEKKKHNPPNQSRNFRIAAGLNQTDVAFLLDIKNFGRISEWENGISNPSIENLIKLSIVYQTLPDQLYYELRKKLVKEIEARRKLLLERKELDVGG